MDNEEEKYSADLYDLLSQEIVPLAPDIIVSIEKIGTHTNYTVSLGKRSCKVRCINLGILQYLISFDWPDYIEAWGRTYQKSAALSAIAKWLQGEEIQHLYEQFDFIDEERRALKTIEKVVTARLLRRTNTTGSYLYNHNYFSSELGFHSEDRACQIHYDCENQIPTFQLFWENTLCYQVQTKHYEKMALVIKRWLYDYSLPTDIEEDPWIDRSTLVKNFTRDRGVEGEFLVSWDLIEEFYYEQIGWQALPVPQILDFIAQMRKRGYDRTLRAGQSLIMFIVSRSRWHGLRDDQPWISFHFFEKGRSMMIKFDQEETIPIPEIELDQQVDAQLKRLEAEEID